MVAILYVLSALIAVWGIVSYFCMGEKFMRWYYGQWGHDYREFDARKFKFAHAVSLFLVGVSGLFAVRLGLKWFFSVLLLATAITNFVLIIQWCKKRDSSSK